MLARLIHARVAWPSGLRRWFKAPVSAEAWVRIPPLPTLYYKTHCFVFSHEKISRTSPKNPQLSLVEKYCFFSAEPFPVCSESGNGHQLILFFAH